MVLATLTRLLRDGDLAEEALHDAFAIAASDWPRYGQPANPTAWLISTGRFRTIDKIRRRARHSALVAEMALGQEGSTDDAPQPLDLLTLIFICCHPDLPQDAQVALTLRSLCGMTTEEIAAAFLQSTPTMAQRIYRAKALLKQRRVPFELPTDIFGRLGPVLAVIYLVFNEGYGAHSGDDLLRPDLSALAISLARDLQVRLPHPEVTTLLALMLFGAARQGARMDAMGGLVALADQDRTKWDRAKIDEGLALLDAAFATKQIGPYTLQAAIAAVHVSASSFDQTDWAEILALYSVLARLAPSPIVSLNRAVALGAAKGPNRGPERAVNLVEKLVAGPLALYGPAHAALGEMNFQLGRFSAATRALTCARDLAGQSALRRHLESRIKIIADLALGTGAATR